MPHQVRALLFVSSLFLSSTAFTADNSRSDSWIVAQSEFQGFLRSEQILYLDLIFDLLSEVEKSNTVTKACIVGGRVLYKNNPFSGVGNDCELRKNHCPRQQVSCAAYLVPNQCVEADSKDGSTKECYRLVTDKEHLAKFFQDSASRDVWRESASSYVWMEIVYILYDYCQVNSDAPSCSNIKAEGLRLKGCQEIAEVIDSESIVKNRSSHFLICPIQDRKSNLSEIHLSYGTQSMLTAFVSPNERERIHKVIGLAKDELNTESSNVACQHPVKVRIQSAEFRNACKGEPQWLSVERLYLLVQEHYDKARNGGAH